LRHQEPRIARLTLDQLNPPSAKAKRGLRTRPGLRRMRATKRPPS